MNDELIQIRSAIPNFAGFADVPARRLSDQQVRAWVGERLAALREREPRATDGSDFEDAIVHCQFGDQHVIKALEDGRFGEPERVAVLEAEDIRLLTIAAGADTVTSDGVSAFVAAVREALLRRNAAIVALDSKR
jgi:hypothetical protein